MDSIVSKHDPVVQWHSIFPAAVSSVVQLEIQCILLAPEITVIVHKIN